MQKIQIKMLSVACLIMPVVAIAAPITLIPTTVIYDGGKSLPITELIGDDVSERYRFNEAKDARTIIEETNAAAQNLSYSASDTINDLFPITSNLKPQKFVSRHMQEKLELGHKNFFIIGDDEFSLKWAVSNHQELLRLGSVGLITNTESFMRYKFIQKLLKPLPIKMVGATAVITEYNVPGYPVLITSEGYFQ
ncbi:PFL_4695 family integrating conjugative element protein [Photobacterium sp. GB-72]|uniref:PFL_4695 family integrating conjugative element protein n=1 Tax=Photobacterium sp. GB-72 TaxID=2022105 RepID=UPI000D173FBC|nr:integrating conjugative element protein [Photobacterium sp. GB-72]PSV27638.1 hypothetical protein C9J40_20090 [Photobacterium sp. GB-72]